MFMIDALKRHPQCEDVYMCLVFKEIRILYIKEPRPKGNNNNNNFRYFVMCLDGANSETRQGGSSLMTRQSRSYEITTH